jgi:hypothetical protein
MFQFSPSITEYLKLLLLPEIPIWEEKILIKELLITSLRLLRRSPVKILVEIREPFKSLRERLKRQRELYHQPTRLKLKLKILLRELISVKYSPELDLRN